MKRQATNGLILIAVIIVVGGVAWFRSAQKDAPAAKNDATAAEPEAAAGPQGSTATAAAKKGELCPEPPPSVKVGDPSASSAPEEVRAVPPMGDKVDTPSSMPASGEDRPEPLLVKTSGSALEPTSERDNPEPAPTAKADEKPTSGPAAPTSEPAMSKKLPRVVDIGAEKCKACKELAPILVELRKEYDGRVTVDFIDVWKNPKAGDPYKIRVIPTQVFFDREGKEVWRHEGFLPKADFVAKFKELGVK